ncbi:hypothetical protein DM01DRAFT_1409750 [Hesseltinella vesiculosa]|uniref:Uncharacterized protein n=1 Tax=Hesseltinella vesiculosa TaxID=101127 RepID=A0A1X2GA13_9FUNG|nr:hypothetical protein DM01DRAFT_1409750 [Hesseltinella vesiculosa]
MVNDYNEQENDQDPWVVDGVNASEIFIFATFRRQSIKGATMQADTDRQHIASTKLSARQSLLQPTGSKTERGCPRHSDLEPDEYGWIAMDNGLQNSHFHIHATFYHIHSDITVDRHPFDEEAWSFPLYA